MFKKNNRYSFKKGMPAKSLNSQLFNLRFQENNEGLKFAVITGKKIDARATVRNRLKRRFSEAFRKVLNSKIMNYSLVFFLKKELNNKTFTEMQAEIENILKKAEILK